MLKKTFVMFMVLAAAVTASAQIKVAVIDVQRVVTESDSGKEALGKLKGLQDSKIAEGQKLQKELDGLKAQLSKQRFTLSDDKIEAMGKQIQAKGIELKRFQDDAQRDLDDARRSALGGLEQRILPVINTISKEKGMTLVFNKFQSGLVYADDAIDITDEVIRRFNTAQ